MQRISHHPSMAMKLRIAWPAKRSPPSQLSVPNEGQITAAVSYRRTRPRQVNALGHPFHVDLSHPEGLGIHRFGTLIAFR